MSRTARNRQYYQATSTSSSSSSSSSSSTPPTDRLQSFVQQHQARQQAQAQQQSFGSNPYLQSQSQSQSQSQPQSHEHDTSPRIANAWSDELMSSSQLVNIPSTTYHKYHPSPSPPTTSHKATTPSIPTTINLSTRTSKPTLRSTIPSIHPTDTSHSSDTLTPHIRTHVPVSPTSRDPHALQSRVADALRDLEAIRTSTYRPATSAGRIRVHTNRPETADGHRPATTELNGTASQSASQLAQIQALMKKLYARNLELTRTIKGMRPSDANGTSTSSSTSSIPSSTSDRPYTATSSIGDKPLDRQQFLLTLRQRDQLIHKLQQQLQKSQHRVRDLEHQQRQMTKYAYMSSSAITSTPSSSTLPVTLPYDQYAHEYASIRQQYETRLKQQWQQATARVTVNKSVASLFQTLQQELIHEACTRHIQQLCHQTHIQHLQQQCMERLVEKKLCDSEITSLQAQLATRDEQERVIETQTMQLLSRCAALEAENHRLQSQSQSVNNTR